MKKSNVLNYLPPRPERFAMQVDIPMEIYEKAEKCRLKIKDPMTDKPISWVKLITACLIRFAEEESIR